MVDRYTKVCLTVIAVSLAVIGLRGLPMIDPARAQSDIQKVVICNKAGDNCANVFSNQLEVAAEIFKVNN